MLLTNNLATTVILSQPAEELAQDTPSEHPFHAASTREPNPYHRSTNSDIAECYRRA